MSQRGDRAAQCGLINFLRVLAHAAISGETWSNWPRPGRADSGSRAEFEAALAEMTATEEFHAYPGLQLMTALRDHAAEDDARATASLAPPHYPRHTDALFPPKPRRLGRK